MPPYIPWFKPGTHDAKGNYTPHPDFVRYGPNPYYEEGADYIPERLRHHLPNPVMVRAGLVPRPDPEALRNMPSRFRKAYEGGPRSAGEMYEFSRTHGTEMWPTGPIIPQDAPSSLSGPFHPVLGWPGWPGQPDMGSQPGVGGNPGTGNHPHPNMGNHSNTGSHPNMGNHPDMGGLPGMGGHPGVGTHQGMGGPQGMGAHQGVGTPQSTAGQPGMGGGQDQAMPSGFSEFEFGGHADDGGHTPNDPPTEQTAHFHYGPPPAYSQFQAGSVAPPGPSPGLDRGMGGHPVMGGPSPGSASYGQGPPPSWQPIPYGWLEQQKEGRKKKRAWFR